MNVLAMEKELVQPEEDAVREYLAGNLCRCSGYMGQMRAIRKYLARGGEARCCLLYTSGQVPGKLRLVKNGRIQMKKMQIMSVTVFQPESNVSLLSGKTRRNVVWQDRSAGWRWLAVFIFYRLS